jgi:UDP-2,3-diacylglucosamine hydrolase
MNNIYFISDIHLGFKNSEQEQLKRKKLHSFLEHIQEDARELYILGDFFDFWFEWIHVIPKYWFGFLHQLRKMTEAGIKIHLIKGNHDFYLGDYLQKEIGLLCHSDSLEFTADHKHFFVAHGDGLARSDRGYRLLKRIIRNPASIFLFRTLIPADLGVQMAKLTSLSSRRIMSQKKLAWEEEYFKFAETKFQQGFDYVILGHLHIPQIRESGKKTYINCGDWIRSFSYACFDRKTLTLNRWDK